MTVTSPQSDIPSSADERASRHETGQDELFFDQLKDQFAFFYALTMVAMDAYKQARLARQQDAAKEDKPHDS